MLDPSCGDGRFLARHRHSVGVEQDADAHEFAARQAPWARIHEGDFFHWAANTRERFDCAAGNPPFIRYQRFSGETRNRAIKLCASLGAPFSSLTSSWAPFLVAAASLLKQGGRLAFVVPAEIGHAPYSVPLLSYLVRNFDRVQIVAIREKIFPDLSEDCWLLYSEGFGGACGTFALTALERFSFMPMPPRFGCRIPVAEWAKWNYRLRPFVLPHAVRTLYSDLAEAPTSTRLGSVARVGIGYVTGANDFFHLRPSDAKAKGIPQAVLWPSVRNGRALTSGAVTHATVKAWIRGDAPILLLRIDRNTKLPPSVRCYLTTPEAEKARIGYKCRNREPWYAVPDVTVPNAFLSYMSGDGVALVANYAGCVCTNSVHAVRLIGEMSLSELRARWSAALTALSCEVEGHPLGGGMLKLEPREAARIVLVDPEEPLGRASNLLREGVETMRRWRHYG